MAGTAHAILLCCLLPCILILLRHASDLDLDYIFPGFCAQPLDTDNIFEQQMMVLKQQYGNQRLYFQLLTANDTYASVLLYVLTWSQALLPGYPSLWLCGKRRLLFVQMAWYDGGTYKSSNHTLLLEPTLGDVFQVPKKIKGNFSIEMNWTNGRIQISSPGVNVKVDGLHLFPQGPLPSGYVPTSSKYAALSHSGMNAGFSGNIYEQSLSNAKGYAEAIATSNAPSQAANFICLYALGTSITARTFFLCSARDGTSDGARGMYVEKGTATWLGSDEFAIRPEGRLQDAFYYNYSISIPRFNISVVLAPRNISLAYFENSSHVCRLTVSMQAKPSSALAWDSDGTALLMEQSRSCP